MEYECCLSDWQNQLQIRQDLNDKPDELKRYEDKLKKAIFQYSRAEGYSAKGKHSTAEKFYNSSESLCEEALEILQKLLHVDASIQQWFDRALDFDANGDLGLTPVAMPRVITSRGFDNQSADMQVMSKREVKIATLEMAISALLAVEVVDKKERKEQENAKLKEFIQSPFLE